MGLHTFSDTTERLHDTKSVFITEDECAAKHARFFMLSTFRYGIFKLEVSW